MTVDSGFDVDGKLVQNTLHVCREYMLPEAESPAETETWVSMFDEADAALQRLVGHLTAQTGTISPRVVSAVVQPEPVSRDELVRFFEHETYMDPEKVIAVGEHQIGLVWHDGVQQGTLIELKSAAAEMDNINDELHDLNEQGVKADDPRVVRLSRLMDQLAEVTAKDWNP